MFAKFDYYGNWVSGEKMYLMREFIEYGKTYKWNY